MHESRDPLITVDMKPLPREPEDEKRKKAKIPKGSFYAHVQSIVHLHNQIFFKILTKHTHIRFLQLSGLPKVNICVNFI